MFEEGSTHAHHLRMVDKHFVYILRSTVSQDRYYVGLTSDVNARLATHNSGGSAHTQRDRPWQLVASLAFTFAATED